MANSQLTMDMITREAIRLFNDNNLFIHSMDSQYSSLFNNVVMPTLAAKEVFVLGAAAIIAKNPKVTRRFWSWFK